MLTLKQQTMLGNIPGDWQVKPLKSLLTGNFPGDWGDDKGPHMVSVLRSTNLTNTGNIDLSDIAHRALSPEKTAVLSLSAGDILLERSGGGPQQPVGRVGFIEADMPDHAFSNFLHLLKPDKTVVNPRFLGWVLYWINQTGRILRLEQQTTQIRNLNFRDYLTMPLPVPDTKEQAAIARILDAVDTAIERAREAVERARILREALIHQLLRNGASKEDRKKSKIGLIPKTWECESLGNHIIVGPVNGLYMPESAYGLSGTKIIRIDSFADGRIHDIKALRRVNLPSKIESRYLVSESDILINRVNALSHIGKSAIVPPLTEPTVFESNMMMLRCDSQILPEFLTLILCSDIARSHWLARAKSAVNQASINQRDVKSLLIPIPLLDEQEKIVAIIRACTKQIECLETLHDSKQQLKKSLLHDLLTGQVRVSPALLEASAGATPTTGLPT